MSIHREFQDKHPALAHAYRKVMNRHFTAAADEHREGASDSSVKRHDDEFRAAETEFITALVAALSDNGCRHEERDLDGCCKVCGRGL